MIGFSDILAVISVVFIIITIIIVIYIITSALCVQIAEVSSAPAVLGCGVSQGLVLGPLLCTPFF